MFRINSLQENPVKSGQFFENLALKYLQQHGLKLIIRNFKCRAGEIDLIMQEHNSLVFVEVRFRKNNDFGSSAESITLQKQSKIIKTAQYYLQKNYSKEPNARFDVVAIQANGKARNQNIEWIKNAFN